MSRRSAALALVLLVALPARAAGDWFDPFRGFEAFVVDDSSWLARDPAAAEDAPALFRVRHLLLLFRSDGGEPRLWNRRNVLLVTLPNGDRWAAELAFVRGGRGRSEEPLAWERLASGHGAVETWSLGAPVEEDARRPEPGAADAALDPCAGARFLVRAKRLELTYHLPDAATRSVRTELSAIRREAFGREAEADLATLNRLRVAPSGAAEWLTSARGAWGATLLDRSPKGAPGDVVLAPDPDPAGDLDDWRDLAWIPSPLQRMDLPEGM